MPTYTGAMPPGIKYAQADANLTAAIASRTSNRWQGGSVAQDGVFPVAGNFFDNSPIAGFPALTFTGAVGCSFSSDFYNRIYLFPSLIEFGAIGESVSKSGQVWNAHLNSVALSDITVTNGDGLQISGPTAPRTVVSLQVLDYTYTALTDGPATLGAEINFAFGGDVGTYTVTLTGSRAKVWPFPPNWAESYRISYNFKTAILTTHSGREQRRALRQQPRKTLSHAVSLRNAEQLREFKALMTTWQNRIWVMPEHTRFVETVTGMAANGQTMAFPSVPSWVVEGATVVLSHGGAAEMRTVESVTPTSVTFDSQTETPWPAGTRLCAGVTGRLATSLDAPRTTNAVANVSVQFNASPGVDQPIPYPEPDTFLDGRPVFLDAWNWANEVSVGSEFPVDMVDFDVGRSRAFSPIGFGTMTKQTTFLARDPDQSDALLGFYHYLRGQWGEFYAPTREPDMDVRLDVSSGVASLRVVGTGVYDNYRDDTVHRAVAVFLRDGTVMPRKILEMGLVEDALGADTAITVTEAWDSEIAVDQVIMVCWMPVWRLASDGLTVEWVTDRVSQVQMASRTLEDIEGDDP